MNKEQKGAILKDLKHIQIDLSEDKIKAVKEKLESFVKSVEKQFDLEDEQEQIMLGIPVCICEDDRGWSTCGGECPVHRPVYYCICGGCGKCHTTQYQGCSRMVAYMKMCVRCYGT